MGVDIVTTPAERATAERHQLLRDLARLRRDLAEGRPTALDAIQAVVAELPEDHPLRRPKDRPVTDKPPVAARDLFAQLIADRLGGTGGQVPAEPPSELAPDDSPRAAFARFLAGAIAGQPTTLADELDKTVVHTVTDPKEPTT
jgi:hypothetical protein